MSGVGSTNAMKKGSGNNPFLAYSEEDMQGYLNSAYTGCIIKYIGPSTKKLMDANASGNAQNLIADISKTLTKGTVAGNVPCNITIHDSQTYYRIYDLYIRRSGGVYDPMYVTNPDALPDCIYAVLLVKNYSNKNQYRGNYNIKDMDVTFLAVEESVSENPDLLKLTENWPLTKGINGWQTNCFNTAGRITLWGYGDTVTYTNNVSSASRFMYDEPYAVNKLYKVVYGDGRYYFEEFYHISDNVTTSTVEDVAPGKTFYDFTGTKQTGTGSKINPYIASTADEMASYLTSSYKGAFVKYIGETVAVGGESYVKNAIYQVAEDGDTTMYAILPTLNNPADPIDVAEGKEVINQLGAVMIGTGNVVLRAATTEGTLMSTPSTWSSGTSGSVTLTESGTYQIKSNLGEAIVAYDGTSQTQSAIIYADASNLYYYDISAEGVITVSYKGKNDSTSGISTNYEIKYRKIGIA